MNKHLYIPSTASTNTLLAERIDEISMDGYIIQTGFQHEGKGQAGNIWESDPGQNLLFSMAVFPSYLPPIQQFLLSKAISLGIVQVLNTLKKGFKIKWPNDIYYHNDKIAGILIETGIMGKTIKHAIVGIGLNVNQMEFTKAPHANSLRSITQRQYDLSDLLNTLRRAMLEQLESLKKGHIDVLNESYLKHLLFYQQKAQYRDERGEFTARIKTVLDNGQMILQPEAGDERAYWMKEVELINIH